MILITNLYLRVEIKNIDNLLVLIDNIDKIYDSNNNIIYFKSLLAFIHINTPIITQLK